MVEGLGEDKMLKRSKGSRMGLGIETDKAVNRTVRGRYEREG